MPPSTRIPPLLQPYVQLPRKESLILLTSTLGASANWLLLRFVSDALSNGPSGAEQNEGHNVILVSWMRDYEFWRQEARKAVGLDLERLKKEGRFAFVDGLSKASLALTSQTPQSATHANTAQEISRQATVGGLVNRVLPVRGAPIAKSTADSAPAGHSILTSLDLTHIATTITATIVSLPPSPQSSPRKTLLIFDNPDLLLALNPSIQPFTLSSLILTLYAHPSISHILTHIQADNPLLSLSTPPQPLELSHHNFLVKYAHMSRRIIGVRVLDTGVARDVSGVVRITEQRTDCTTLGFDEEESKDEGIAREGQGKEFLYQVKGDGGVRVFERGAGGDG